MPTLISANSTNQTNAIYTVNGQYDAGNGILYFERQDSSGNTIERMEKFYPVPPVSTCYQTTYGDVIDNLYNLPFVFTNNSKLP